MAYDPVLLEIMNSLLSAVAEEMGAALGRTAYSPNIKERRDFSCAVFDAGGQMVAQAAHIPVHLGAMPLSVAAALARMGRLEDGDIVVLNDPYSGGSHLPDITMVSPVYAGPSSEPSIPPRREAHDSDSHCEGAQPRSNPIHMREIASHKPLAMTCDPQLLGYVASRAHHADVGGIAPGSMPLARELFQEGLIIPPVRLQRRGEPDEAVFDLITRNSRTPEERLGDLASQMAAQHTGIRRLAELAARYGAGTLAAYMGHLQDYAERAVRRLIARMPAGRYAFRDVMDDDGFGQTDIPIAVAVEAAGDGLTVDFTGTAPQAAGGINAVRSVTLSAVFYVVRCLAAAEPGAGRSARGRSRPPTRRCRPTRASSGPCG